MKEMPEANNNNLDSRGDCRELLRHRNGEWRNVFARNASRPELSAHRARPGDSNDERMQANREWAVR
jgi:hypothetical protein